MSSWNLLQRLLSFWTATTNPVFRREMAHPPVWQGAVTHITSQTGMLLFAGGLGCYAVTLLVFYLNNLLLLLAPLLVVWMLLLGLTLAPTIVLERQHHTWETLLLTPLGRDTILLGKASGALWWLRDMLRVFSGVILLTALIVGIASISLTPTDLNARTSEWPVPAVCGALLAYPLVMGALFLVDRVQQFILMVVAALAASAKAPTERVALVGAATATLTIWLVDIGIATILIALQPVPFTSHLTAYLLRLATLGPAVGFLIAMPIGQMLAYTVGTLVVRELAIRALWHWLMNTSGEL